MASEADHPLAQLRAVVGVTQESLSGVSGVARSTVAAIESAGTSPSKRTIRRLAAAFSMDPEAMDAVLRRAVSVATIAKSLRWKGTSSDPPLDASVVDSDDRGQEAVELAAVVQNIIATAFRRNRATLDELDIVRRWFNALGPVSPMAEILAEADEQSVSKFLELLFFEARSDPGLPGGSAVLSVALQMLSRLDWEMGPLAEPYSFSIRSRKSP